MNLGEERRLRHASVKRIISIYQKLGFLAVVKFLMNSDTIIEEKSWGEKIRNLIKDGKTESVKGEIELISQIFKFENNGK